ncbi:hypothetical protein ACWD26_21755 [Streptomyces sp. NPDC002787]
MITGLGPVPVPFPRGPQRPAGRIGRAGTGSGIRPVSASQPYRLYVRIYRRDLLTHRLYLVGR